MKHNIQNPQRFNSNKVFLEEQQFDEEIWGSNIKWKKNKFLEGNNQFENSPNDLIDVSLEEQFMNQHSTVLIESFSEYLRSVSRVLHLQLSVQDLKIPSNQKSLKDLDYEAFLIGITLLTTQQKLQLKDKIKYSVVLYWMVGYAQTIIPQKFKYEVVLVIYQIYQYFQNINVDALDDEQDICEIAEYKLGDVADICYNQPRLINIFFQKKSLIINSIHLFLHKMFYTMLCIEKGYFTNKYYNKKRVFRGFKKQDSKNRKEQQQDYQNYQISRKKYKADE